MAPLLKPHRMTGDDWVACGVVLFGITGLCLVCFLAAAAVESFIMRELVGPQPCICVPAEGS